MALHISLQCNVMCMDYHISLTPVGKGENECGKEDISLLLPRLQALFCVRDGNESSIAQMEQEKRN